MPMTVRPGHLFQQDPDASVLTYEMQWADWLATGAQIATSFWVVSGPDTTLTATNNGFTVNATSVQLSNGTMGRRYRVTNQIATNETPPQTEQRSFFVRMVNL